MPNPVYFRCQKCGGIRMQKAGTNKRRRYVCQRCGAEQTHGHGFDVRKKGAVEVRKHRDGK